jgi:hypothetical protein
MILWMGGELESDVVDAYREVRNIVEAAVNSRLSTTDYGPAIVKWAFIAMILSERRLSEYKEVKQYNKKRKTCEFRLVVDHSQFTSADLKLRTRMICHALLRSLSLLEELKIEGIKVAALGRDFESIAREHQWLD